MKMKVVYTCIVLLVMSSSGCVATQPERVQYEAYKTPTKSEQIADALQKQEDHKLEKERFYRDLEGNIASRIRELDEAGVGSITACSLKGIVSTIDVVYENGDIIGKRIYLRARDNNNINRVTIGLTKNKAIELKQLLVTSSQRAKELSHIEDIRLGEHNWANNRILISSRYGIPSLFWTDEYGIDTLITKIWPDELDRCISMLTPYVDVEETLDEKIKRLGLAE